MDSFGNNLEYILKNQLNFAVEFAKQKRLRKLEKNRAEKQRVKDRKKAAEAAVSSVV
jgi:hypothetical protein